jgi:hypothetical protein
MSPSSVISRVVTHFVETQGLEVDDGVKRFGARNWSAVNPKTLKTCYVGSHPDQPHTPPHPYTPRIRPTLFHVPVVGSVSYCLVVTYTKSKLVFRCVNGNVKLVFRSVVSIITRFFFISSWFACESLC